MRPTSTLAYLTLITALYSPLLQASPATPADPSGISAGTYIQTFFGLLLIVALIAGMAWYARKLSGGQPFGRHLLRVIGGVSLGPKERIVLVEIGEQWLVIGLVPGQIRTLHTLPRGELPPGQTGDGERPFASWLKLMTEQRKNHA